MGTPQDPPYPVPPAPIHPPDPDAPPDPNKEKPNPVPLPSARDPRADPQPGDELLGRGELRRVVRREGDILWCQAGAIRYKTMLQGWHEWCRKSAEE
jgi:hypothetical protein